MTAAGLLNCETESEALEWRSVLEDEVARYLKHEPSGHDAQHARRVCRVALRLAETVQADPEVVEAAALLHDIGHTSGRDQHAERGTEIADLLLRHCAYPDEKRALVLDCIRFHEWRPDRGGDPARPTVEYQAFADADRLDALGALGIARVFSFGGAHGRPIWAPDAPPSATDARGGHGASSIQHFYDKLLHLPDQRYTELGRAWARRRLRFLTDFLEEFYAEWQGEDFLDGAGTGATVLPREMSGSTPPARRSGRHPHS